jgi:hypothetical protein
LVYTCDGTQDHGNMMQEWQSLDSNWLSIYIELRSNGEIGPPLWSSGQRSGFDSRYQIFWEVVGLERGPLSLVRIIEELLEWKSSGSDLENRINGRGIRWADHAAPSIRK